MMKFDLWELRDLITACHQSMKTTEKRRNHTAKNRPEYVDALVKMDQKIYRLQKLEKRFDEERQRVEKEIADSMVGLYGHRCRWCQQWVPKDHRHDCPATKQVQTKENQ
jgi:erythromycin esterase-like protein